MVVLVLFLLGVLLLGMLVNPILNVITSLGEEEAGLFACCLSSKCS